MKLIERPELWARRQPARGRGRRRLPSLSVIPTLCTLGNLVCGFAAINYALKPLEFIGAGGWSGLTVAGALVFLGMFFDAIDGSIARLTRSTSELGAQLDSLADVITFGAAPAFMMIRLANIHMSPEDGFDIIGPGADSTLGKIVWGIAAVYVCCTALRLARFNVEVGSTANEHLTFRGLPSPGAGGAIASLIILHQHFFVVRFDSAPPDMFARAAALGVPFITLLCALGMVSSVRYTHIVNRYLLGPRSFGYVVRLVIPLLLAIWKFQITLAVLFTAYALSGFVRVIIIRLRERRRGSGPASA